MIFSDEEFIKSMDESPVSAIINCIDIATAKIDYNPSQEWTEYEQEILREVIAIIEILIESNKFNYSLFDYELSGNITKDCERMLDYIAVVKNKFSREAAKIEIDIYKNHYKSALKSSFAYEFSQGDVDRIQTLVNELRERITNMDNLSDNHKARLLKRLEKLQSELHKRLSDLDRFWGILIDAGVVLCKLGDDAKPIVDRIKEISEIVWRTQARAEELPSNSPYPSLDEIDT